MADVMQQRSTLDEVLRPGRGGASGTPGLTVRERRALTIVQVSEIPGVAGRRSEVATTLELALPAPRKSVVAGARAALWVGPGRWFIIEPRAGDLAARLDHVAAGTFAVTDLSHSRTVLRLSGPKVRDVLAKGCAVDLHPRSLAAGGCIVAGVARHSAVLHVVDATTIDLYVYRSFGQDLLEWLIEAAAEYGYEIVA